MSCQPLSRSWDAGASHSLPRAYTSQARGALEHLLDLCVARSWVPTYTAQHLTQWVARISGRVLCLWLSYMT